VKHLLLRSILAQSLHRRAGDHQHHLLNAPHAPLVHQLPCPPAAHGRLDPSCSFFAAGMSSRPGPFFISMPGISRRFIY
jgi:hypothetical protein